MHCIQRELIRRRLLAIDSPTGYLGEATAEALSRASPPPRPAGSGSGPTGAFCIDVCADTAESSVQTCETRCVPDAQDRYHACRDACVLALSAVCHRAFPDDDRQYAVCVSREPDACRGTCARWS